MNLKKKTLDVEQKFSESEVAYLYIAKNYINHLDLDYFNQVTDNILSKSDAFEESFLDAHHQIISDMLRYINKNIFKGNSERTLLWMERELNSCTWEAFNSMVF